MADSDSRIAWHRAQLKKNREALKALEVARFRSQHDKLGDVQKAMFELERKIAESEKCIAGHERVAVIAGTSAAKARLENKEGPFH